MKIKKAHNGAMSFCSARKLHLIKNMRESLKICMYTCRILILMFIFLNVQHFAFGVTFDEKALKMYMKIIPIAKWGIAFKGAFETMHAVATGDVQSAKRNFVGYIMAFIILMALPSAMNEVQATFQEGLY